MLRISAEPTCRPESLGLVCASIYILLLILFIPFAFSDFFNSQRQSTGKPREGLVINEFPHHQVSALFTSRCLPSSISRCSQLSVYLSSLLSLLMATMLGFLDDVFDIRWRHKLPIPIIASIPLLMVYYSERGATDVVVPIPLRWLLGSLLNLGESLSRPNIAAMLIVCAQDPSTTSICRSFPPSARTASTSSPALTAQKSAKRS